MYTMNWFHEETKEMTRHLFFTGKGGVGKTSTACATAISLVDQGKKVLIVSTDPASNLQDVFEMEIPNHPIPITNVPNLYAANLDPEQAAAAYREKAVGPYRDKLPASVISDMEEQLSGACTVEIAAFDEFTNLLSNPEHVEGFDHILFDTAPTGHTLRLLQLPTAWSGFLSKSTHGASCLGPLSGLSEKKEAYAKTVEVLSDDNETTLILVTRLDMSSLTEAERASQELRAIGIQNQQLLINGVLQDHVQEDEISSAFYERQQKELANMPNELKTMKRAQLPLVSYSLTGMDHLRKWASGVDEEDKVNEELDNINIPGLGSLLDDLKEKDHGVIFTMGKGGVGKTTMASAIAVGLAEQGHTVHLTTTDPAAHLSHVIKEEEIDGRLTVSRIDPKDEVAAYRKEVLQEAAEGLDANGLAYLEEDLNSPCTEEIAFFRAFARVVDQAKGEFVVVDTAPTGHTLLLLDAAKSYHKEIARSTGDVPESVKKLLPRLRDPEETTVVLVTLAEATPVLEATRLQEDLKRAEVSPQWWIINQSFATTPTRDPILRGRGHAEIPWIDRVKNELAQNCAIVPWQTKETVGYKNLKTLLS